MPDKYVTIVHADGREFSVLPKDFTSPRTSPDRESYAERGFKIVGYTDGTPYDGPTSQREIDRAAEERQAAREAQAATASKADDKPAARSKD
jgi:hypothetical protein